MRKTLKATILTLAIVLAMSFLLSTITIPFFKNFFNKKTYSVTNCLTERINDDMDIYDIAKMYRDGNATVAVTVSGTNKTTGESYIGHGSGVCVASNGYKTSLLNGYTAKKGSYIVTNYHVIDIYDGNDYVNKELNILAEDENFYSAQLLWFNEDLDVAIVYSDDINLNYVSMKDRIIDCSSEYKLDYEQIFTIGTPVKLDYINRLTVGNVASNNPMQFYTLKKIYTNQNVQENLSYSNFPTKNNIFPYTVLSNLYEDVIDISLGISSGNSGGGCFDSDGFLVGLTTLGTDVQQTNGNQMNGMVSIYPIIKVLDKVIDNHENRGTNTIFTFDTLGIKGLDAVEGAYVSYVKEDSKSQFYFLDGVVYPDSKKNVFDFDYEGYYIISNSGNTSLITDYFITSCKKNNESEVDIIDRNDFIYFLLNVNNGDKVTFTVHNIFGNTKTIESTF